MSDWRIVFGLVLFAAGTGFVLAEVGLRRCARLGWPDGALRGAGVRYGGGLIGFSLAVSSSRPIEAAVWVAASLLGVALAGGGGFRPRTPPT